VFIAVRFLQHQSVRLTFIHPASEHYLPERSPTMVFLTAAAVTAGAYGAYKGGEAAVKGAQSKVRDIKLERNGKKEYDAKSRERKERLSTISQKHGAAAGAGAAGGIESSPFASAAGASDSGSAGGAASNNKSVEERLRERRSMKASAAAHGTGSVAKKKKGSSVLGRFSKKN